VLQRRDDRIQIGLAGRAGTSRNGRVRDIDAGVAALRIEAAAMRWLSWVWKWIGRPISF